MFQKLERSLLLLTQVGVSTRTSLVTSLVTSLRA